MSGLSFVVDRRLSIVTPQASSEVSLPFEVAWVVENYAGGYAVFFDRSPMRPGQDIASLVPEGDPCQVRPDCPDEQWLSDRNIYVTTETRILIEHLPDRRSDGRSEDRHDLTIVLMNDDGQRVGESVFTREFVVDREAD